MFGPHVDGHPQPGLNWTGLGGGAASPQASACGPRERASMPPMISVAAVTKRYMTGFLALDSVDLAIEKGEIFALLGPNGAAKTTLIGAICGTISMSSGKVLVDGHDVVG